MPELDELDRSATTAPFNKLLYSDHSETGLVQILYGCYVF